VPTPITSKPVTAVNCGTVRWRRQCSTRFIDRASQGAELTTPAKRPPY
jgi:hypothetical protein